MQHTASKLTVTVQHKMKVNFAPERTAVSSQHLLTTCSITSDSELTAALIPDAPTKCAEELSEPHRMHH